MERVGFMLKNTNGSWWTPVTYGEGGRVTASVISYGSSSQRWKQYGSESAARAVALRLVKRLAKTEGDEAFNSIVERWFTRN